LSSGIDVINLAHSCQCTFFSLNKVKLRT